MKLRIKVSPSSKNRDKSFTTAYDGVSYTIGPEPVEVSEKAGNYLIGSYSGIMEVVPDVVTRPAEAGPTMGGMIDVRPVKKTKKAGKPVKKK